MKRHRGRGEGSISLRKDGRWCAIVSLGWEGGKRKRKTIYGTTRQEVAKALTAALRTRDQGLPLPTSGGTVEHYLARWLQHINGSVRPRTYESFESIVRRHIVPDLGKIQLEKLTPDHVQTLLNRKLASGLAPQTVRHMRTVLGIALTLAVRWNILGRNVAALTKGPRVERPPIKPLDSAAVKRMLDYLRSDRLETIYVMSVTTAMRRGEVLGLRWDDVDLDARKLYIRTSLQRVNHQLLLVPPKTKDSAHEITLPARLIEALKRQRIRQKEAQLAAGAAWKGNRDNLVFTSVVGTALEPRNITARFKSIIRKAGLPDPVATTRLHDLRHTCATLLFVDGAHPKQVQALLGHSRLSTTLDTYTHVVPSMLDDTAARVDSIFE